MKESGWAVRHSYAVSWGDPFFYEVVPKGYSKATGIEFICRYLQVPRERTIGFGYSTNDLPMLAFTQISVAMGDGNPDIFSKVDYVTDSVMRFP